ncbi:MAG: hypothetical protein ACKVZ0_22920 [Gemmatimonadales bacterium]
MIVRVAVALLIAFPLVARAQAPALELVPARARVVAGDEIRFELRAAGGAPVAGAQWLIGPFDVAAVSQAGVVRGLRHGTAALVVRSGGRTVTAEIIVDPKGPATIAVSADPAELVPGGVTVVTALPYTADRDPLTGQTVRFRSTAPEVATVDPAGVVVGRKVGQTTIVAEAGAARGEVVVRVVANRAARLEVTGPVSARTGDVVRFTSRATDARGQSADPAPVRWSVDRAGATVYPDGGFVAERPGTYLITGVVGTVAGSVPITVGPRVHDRTFEVVGSATYGHLQAAEHWAINDVLYVSTIADRLYTYDITNPASPRLTDSLVVDARLINDISTTPDGKIGLITRQQASSRKNGIVFLDLADPFHPQILSEYTATVSGGVHSAFIDGHYVYLNDGDTQSMRVISFADPKNPREVGRWQVETSVMRTTTSGQVEGRSLHDLQIKDGLAYLAYWKDGLIVLDVGNGIKGGSPENPKFVSQFTYNHADFYPPGMIAGTHSVFRYGKYLVVGDEVFPGFFDINAKDRIKTLGRLHILDVSDIERPRKVAEYSVPNAGSHNMWVENDVMYVGNFEAGVRAVDMSGELRGDLYAQGREIGSIWTGAPGGYRANLPMAWGAQPHRGHVYATDINSGVWVGRLTPKRLVP